MTSVHNAGAQASIETSVTLTPASVRIGEQPGDQIGPYRLLEVIGEGGFGVVWIAERREPMVQRVAIKIIKPGMDSRAVIARFEQERQALALMDHPGVARVLDGGVTPAGRPFFVMQLVRGEPITTFCDRVRMPIGERLRLFTSVCEAVQHAHMKGIIHRDIKPSNVLVTMQDGHALAQVIDFGIAKATSTRLTDKTVFTEQHQIIGTPEYMSPEQSEGSADIDTRTDVYALGVMLYELIAGSTPFAGTALGTAAFGEIQRIIREVDPPAPSLRISTAAKTIQTVAQARDTSGQALIGAIRGELDWIVMRAIEKDRQRRYDTPAQLAEDISRYLRGEAILAAPPSRSYRLRKLVRRNRVAVVAGSAVTLALILGVVGTTLGMVAARRERAAAILSAAQAVEAADRASSAERIAKARLAESEATVDFLDQMLAAADPSAKGKDVTVRALVDESSAQISKRYADQPLVAARLHATVGRTYSGLGLFDQAEPHIRQAYELRLKELGPKHEDTCAAKNDVCLSMIQRGKPEAEQATQELVREHEALFGRSHPITVQSIAMLAQMYSAQNMAKETEPLIREVVDARLKSPGKLNTETISAMNLLALTEGELGKIDEAEKLFTEAIEAQVQLNGPEHPLSLIQKSDFAWMLYWTSMDADGGKSEKSKERLRRAKAICEQTLEVMLRVMGEEHRDTLACLSNLSTIEKQLENWEEAEKLGVRALELSVRVLGEEHPDTIVSLANVGNMLRLRGRLDEAAGYLKRAVLASRKSLSPDSPGLAYALGWYGTCLAKMGRFEEGEMSLLEASAIVEKSLGADSPILQQLSLDVADLYQSWASKTPGKGYEAKEADWRAKAKSIRTDQPRQK